MKNLFSENRLIYRHGGEKPRPREMAKETNELSKEVKHSLAVEFYRALSGRGKLEEGLKRLRKKSPDQQKKILSKWMKESVLKKETEANKGFGGGVFGAAETEKSIYKYRGKKINPDKAAKELAAYVNKKENHKKIKKEMSKKNSANIEIETKFSGGFKVEGFSGSSKEQAEKRAKIAEKFYKDIAEKIIKNTMINNENDANNLQNRLNQTLHGYGVDISIGYANGKVGYELKFNGTKAWPKISSRYNRRKARRDILRKRT